VPGGAGTVDLPDVLLSQAARTDAHEPVDQLGQRERRLVWHRWQGPTPGYNGQSAQLTEARKVNPWLAEGSQTVQQQALRDLDQAWRNFFAGTHDRPTWRKRGQGRALAHRVRRHPRPYPCTRHR
jgi:transposase